MGWFSQQSGGEQDALPERGRLGERAKVLLATGAGKAEIIAKAVEGPITIKGKNYDNSAMPPFRGALNENQIAAIATYVRGNKDWGNSAGHVTPAQVKAIMEATSKNAGTKWRATSLQSVP